MKQLISSNRKRWLNAFFLFTLVLLGINNAEAQQQNITGTVIDATTKQPLVEVSIVVKGTSMGVLTDTKGNFTLPQVSPDAIIEVSYIGYTTQEIQINNKTHFEIVLQEDRNTLSEVIVVGFGTQKKENLTGAVGIATSKDLENRPVMVASQALQGLVPGLNIAQSNGSLEERPSINIRGRGTIGAGSTGSPLILIDGIEGNLNAINPQDIDNISVLKDAAASSIYGSQAPFGVILVTTKKGKSGKTTINYNNSFRWNKPLLLPEMMDSYTFALFMNSAATNGGGNPHFGQEWLQRIKDYQDGKIKTTTIPTPWNPSRWEDGFDIGGNDNQDYYKVLFRSHAFSQEHNLSMSGGAEKYTYYTSFNFLDQGGLMNFNQDKYKRYGATAKLSYDVNSFIRFNYTARFIRENYERPAALTNSLYQDIGRQGWPVLPLYDPNGNLFEWHALKLRDGGTDKAETDYLFQQGQFVIEPVKNWKTFVELNYAIKTKNRHWDKQMIYQYDVNNNPYVWDKSSNVHEDLLKENLLGVNIYSEYTFSLAQNHNFKAMIGTQSQQMKQIQFGLQRSGVLVSSLPEIDLTSGYDFDGKQVIPSVNGGRGQWAVLGYFGRINYDYKGRYLAEVNLRYDGSSRYRKGHRWVWSPSFSLGWNIAQEEFWGSLSNTINTLKVRGSYGQLSNQNTTNWYPTYEIMGVTANSGTWLMNGVKPNTSWAPLILVDPFLTWEKIRTLNIGFDFGAFNNRLTASFDYFTRETRDMVGPAPERPVILGVKVPNANNTDLKDYGFELQIGWQDQLSNGLGYGVRFLLSDSQTKILKYPNLTNSLNTYIAGRKIGEIWGYQTIGIAKTNDEMNAHLAKLPNGGQNAFGSQWAAGDIMYADLNNDGQITNGSNTLNDHGDLKVIGNNTPRFRFGLELNASWKGFDFSAFFQGVMKREVWQNSYFFWGADGGGIWWSTGFKEHSDYFRADANDPLGQNINSYYPRPLFNNKNKQTQSGYLQDASYLRLKNLQIGYTLPAELTKKFYIPKLRVFVSGENLWTLTKMKKMFDPETIDGGWGGSVYPLSKVLSFGVSINL